MHCIPEKLKKKRSSRDREEREKREKREREREKREREKREREKSVAHLFATSYFDLHELFFVLSFTFLFRSFVTFVRLIF